MWRRIRRPQVGLDFPPFPCFLIDPGFPTRLIILWSYIVPYKSYKCFLRFYRGQSGIISDWEYGQPGTINDFKTKHRVLLKNGLNRPGTAQVGAMSKAQKDSKTTFSTTGDNKSSQKTKNWEKRDFFEFFFEVSGKSHSAEKCKRGDAFSLMLDALDALKMKY